MKEEDYTKTLPLLFGEDFGAKVKGRMEEAAALKKTLAQSSKGKEKAGFHGGYPRKNTGGCGVADKMSTALDQPRSGNQPQAAGLEEND